MPQMPTLDDLNTTLHGFQYSAVAPDKLTAVEYTLFVGITDETGSVSPFKAALENVLRVSIDACKKSPRSENLLVRQTAFSARNGNVPNIRELHGFQLLKSVNPDDYKGSLHPNGGTPLIDAVLEGVDSLYDYGKELKKKRYITNAILIAVTDGDENASDPNHTMSDIKNIIARLSSENVFESIRTILVGVNDTDSHMKTALDRFKAEAGLDEYISIGDATPGKLAKLAQFVSQSVSSQSQALGTGGASQPISFTF